MKITDNYIYKPCFGRRLRPVEAKEYTKVVKKGLEVLDKELGIIVHNSTTPSNHRVNTGIGSLLSTTAQNSFIPFLEMHGISTIQQEPDNIRNKFNPSPYMPFATSKNVYMIPLEKLASEEYAEILPLVVFNTIVSKRPNIETNEIDYNYVHQNYDDALKVAYINFLEKLDNPEKSSEKEYQIITELKENFENFKAENYEEMEPHAIFEILTNINQEGNWRKWGNTDRNLYTLGNPKQNERSMNRISQIRKDYAPEIDLFFFKQMILEKEIEKAQNITPLRIIADSPIAFTDVEVWKNQALFFDNLSLGCPPDRFSKKGQRLGFAVLRPETIFDEDGSLGKGGVLLQKRYEKMFKNANGGIRIDHIAGLIDPFVYKTSEKGFTSENSGRLYSSPNSNLLGRYAKTSDEEYEDILTKIVFPAAEKYGLSKDDIICEDLGEITEPVKRVMEKFGLKGVAVTQFDDRGSEQSRNKVIMLGSHDNPSFIDYTRDLYEDAEKTKNGRKFLNRKIDYLVSDTIIPNQKSRKYKKQMQNCQTDFMTASFTELFTSPAKQVQIFFTDFFGLDGVYNNPEVKNNNWTMRMPDEIERVYHDNLKKNKGINIPEVLARAIRNKGEDFSSQHESLLEDLDKFTKILKL